jgi:hypothetical protein
MRERSTHEVAGGARHRAPRQSDAINSSEMSKLA